MATNQYDNLGRPKFVADEGSVMLHGTGVQIKWDDWNGATKLPAGTVIDLDGNGKAIPATEYTPEDVGDGDPGDPEFPEVPASAYGILVQDVDTSTGQNKSFHGVYLGGAFYENLMPEAGEGVLEALGERFYFQTYGDARTD